MFCLYRLITYRVCVYVCVRACVRVHILFTPCYCFKIGLFCGDLILLQIYLRNLNPVVEVISLILNYDSVHRCGIGGNMRACHAAGPGSIPDRDKFSWVRFFRGFSSPIRQMSGNFRPTRSSNIIWPS